MHLTSAEISAIVKGELKGPRDLPVSNLIIDSRKSTLVAADTLFVALRGSRNDGRNYIIPLYKMGVRVFLTESEREDSSIYEYCQDAAFIEVTDCLEALQMLAKAKRDAFKGTVIAITGSNGKTIVKEWFADILGSQEDVLRSPRSYNSQTGVPLSVWNLNNTYSYGVFEAGMSMPGEIARLKKIIQAHIGVLTNIGEAHQENFKDLESKIREKLLLFSSCHTLIYSVDQPEVTGLVDQLYAESGKKLIRWSFTDKGVEYYYAVRKNVDNSIVLVLNKGDRVSEYVLPFSDKASVKNAATVITMLFSIGVSEDIIRTQMSGIKPVEMRMEQKDGINGCTLIEDYYNSDPAALGIALDFLKQTNTKKRRVIISDFVQHRKGDVYAGVANLIRKSGASSLICIGEELYGSREKFSEESLFFKTTDEFITWFKPEYFKDEVILLKGARKFRFERISSLLVKKAHITTLEINLNNLLKNLNLIRSGLSEGTRVMAMVKAFAYGAGPGQISDWLVKNSVDFLTVAFVDEGVQLREYGISARIMVMNPDPQAFNTMIKHDLEPEIYSMEVLKDFIEELRLHGIISYPAHIKLDTGMHRLGFVADETDNLCTLLASANIIRVASVFTHLAASDDPSLDKLTHLQAERFILAASRIEEALGYSFLRHILNSSGVLRFPEYQFDMVRLGIGLFGAGSNDPEGALPVISFYSSVSQLKNIPAGEGIGYGFTDSSDIDRDIAIIPVGYADGLNRKLGNGNGYAVIKSTKVPFVGKICMDMSMLDVSGLDIKRGDRIEIFGSNIGASVVAELCETISYEIISSISPRVKRVYLYD